MPGGINMGDGAATATIATKVRPAKSFSATMTPTCGKRNIFANIAEGVDARMVGTITSGSKTRLSQFEADLQMMVSAPELYSELEHARGLLALNGIIVDAIDNALARARGGQ